MKQTCQIWKKPDGTPVSCTEKIMVLNENYQEIRELLQEAFDDAILMGCSKAQVREIYADLVNSIEFTYSEQTTKGEKK
ncbi:MAG: hypothetical protein IJ022_04050 [Burkholderiaceae bacterium]|nr:hypothetical protein [Burkholderiaceae bacterium]